MKLISMLVISIFIISCSKSSDDNSNNGKFGTEGETPKGACTPTGATNDSIQAEPSISCQMVFSMDGNACTSVRWLIGPNTEIENAFQLSFTKNNNPYTPNLKVGAVAVLLEDVNGVQNKRFDLQVNPIADQEGEYFVDGIDFTKGVWQVRIQLFDDGKLVEEHDGPHGLIIFE